MYDIKPRGSRKTEVARPIIRSTVRTARSSGFAHRKKVQNTSFHPLTLRAVHFLDKAHQKRAKKISRRILKKTRVYLLSSRMFAVCFSLLFFASLIVQFAEPKLSYDKYDLSTVEGRLLSAPVPAYGDKLTTDTKSGVLQFNSGYTPTNGEVMGQSSAPKITASFGASKAKNAVSINDPVNSVGITLTPKFDLDAPRKNQNRVVYPIVGKNASKVFTLKGDGVKEDIIVNKYSGDELKFEYTIQLPDGLEARVEKDGSLGVYGATSALLGDVSTGSEKDAELLKKARDKADKTQLIFKIPAPFIREAGKKTTNAKAQYALKDNKLTVKATQLRGASYPLSIDPSVYVETARKLMRGNNETNVDFDTNNELIQKSQTTGARIDAWQDNLDMTTGTFDHGTAAAGGYIYRAGGQTGPTKPSVAETQQTLDGSAGLTFTMNMPATRPAGDLYVAILCYDGSTSGVMTPPAGWTEYADIQGHAAYWKVGTNVSGGNEAASYQWTKSSVNAEFAGTIMRITNFDSADPVSGTPGTGSNAGTGTPTFPATTPDNDTTLVVRGTGFDTDDPSATGWVPAGHTKIDSESSSNGGAGSCGFAAATLDTSPLNGVSSGTAAFADASVSDDYGASTIAINPVAVTPATQSSIYWAQFNSTSHAIESPNPGNGVCSGWCTDSVYNMPGARRGASVVAYNGYLYVIGGVDGSGTRQSTIYIAKLGANGEPQLWDPTNTNPASWNYWYTVNLNGSTARSYLSAGAYNNRMYILGGQTNASGTTGTTTVEYADVLPNGKLGTWSAGSSFSNARYGQSVQIYNDNMYIMGGSSGTTPKNDVQYVKISSTGSLNVWKTTTSFATNRVSLGGNFTTVWGAYIYLSGGCGTQNASGYCTNILSDTQIGSLNADGTISEWGSVTNLVNQRMGYTLMGWQGGLYRLGGCSTQNTSTGACISTVADVDFGVINEAGEVSTVDISQPSGSGNCTGAAPTGCDLPPLGDAAGQSGQMLSQSTILNGYLYNIGGCVNVGCTDVSGNTAYAVIGTDGKLGKPATCVGSYYGAWCVDSTNRINGTTGIAAGGITTFNDRIYVIGGVTGAALSTNLYYNSITSTGALAGAWTATDMTTAGIADDVAYTYVYSRANPASAGTNPGNLYVFGGCSNNGGGAGCGGSAYEQGVYKCNITTAGAVSGCTRTGQLQIDSTPGYGAGTDGLGIHSGTVYANYIYLIGGISQAETDKDDVMYAKFDNNNNVVAVSGSDWIESPNKMSVGRRRGFSFGYNGHIYAVGGYDASGTGIIPFIEWSGINVSDGSIDPFVTSSVTINQRWGLTMVVSNSYAYVIGGCDNGASPTCSSFEDSIQTFQLYNNDSGAANDFTAQGDQTFATDTDRWGADSTVYNGYLYVAGGCISATDCTNATNSVQYAPISADDGSIGTWVGASGAGSNNLPADRAWGSLEVAGGTLYYLGGQDDTATNEQSTVYYTTSITAGAPTWNATAAAGGIGDTNTQAAQERTKFGSAVWNNRIYIVGGLNVSATATKTVYVSPQLNSGGTMAADSWTQATDFNVVRTGAAVTTYANNLYLFGGYDGANYLSDSQFGQIDGVTGLISSWTYSTSLPGVLRDAKAVSANGYIYIIGGRSAASTCVPNVLITPISANTTIASGNNPTGVGEWYETNVRYTGDRYGAAITYADGKLYTMGGGCTAPLAANRHYQSTVRSQPQVAKYSRLIDTDTDVFPTKWLMNGLDNSIGARWTLKYKSMNDTDGVATDCGTADMSTWGQETNYGDVSLGTPAVYNPLDGSGANIGCARFFYFFVSIDASKTFGYPEDVNRGPTISDLSLFFTSDPSKRLRHGKTFTGGEQQPLDTPF